MSQKTKNAYERDKIMLAFVSENCSETTKVSNLQESKEEYEAYRDSLSEIDCMIQYMQDLELPNEVAEWRRMMMRSKMAMREIKARINTLMDANNAEKEITYS